MLKLKQIKLTKHQAVIGLIFLVACSLSSVVALQPGKSAEAQPLSTDGAPTTNHTAAPQAAKAKPSAQQAAAALAKASQVAAAEAAQKTAAANQTASAASAPPMINPTDSLYAYPNNAISQSARAWANSHPADAGKMNRLAATPMAQWFGNWNGNVQADAHAYVSSAGGQLPVVVAYNIPQRDCGSYSAGGAASAADYKAWVSSLAAGIGQRKAIVIVEPDGLASMDCLSTTDQQTRTQLLSYAVQTLRAQTQASIYLDAGNSNWQPAGTMSSRLQAAGVASANGFSLNVSNFYPTASNLNYGHQLASLLGGKHFVVDTSRNGNGAASGDMAWCNPNGRALGDLPRLQTGDSLADAYLWVKNPGESDGNCGTSIVGTSPPAAGVWWPEYALMLAANSGW